MTSAEFQQEHVKLLHAVQTGILYVLEKELGPYLRKELPYSADPFIRVLKHIRVGIDSAKAENGMVSRLLVRKGLITQEEYYDLMMEAYRDEVRRYQQTLSQEYGMNIKLG